MVLLEIERKKGLLNVIHFLGIGGIGMSGIAEIMHNLGYRVQGSDITTNNNTRRLENKGIKIFTGHDKDNIQSASYIVVSTAIKDDNPELDAAKKSKIPIIRRAEMLAELMRLKCAIAVSGSHGKTTTTSLIACLFESAGFAPTVINGGIINHRSTNAYLGQDDYLIVEADESDATFVKIPSTIGVITNIDPEHIDYYKNFDNLKSAFKSFIRNLPFYGFGVACIDHPVVKNLVENITERKIITYGIDSQNAHIRAYNIKSDSHSSTFDIKIELPNSNGATLIEKIMIPIVGRHNILNVLASISVGIELDFGIKTIQNGFKNFQGVKRRFTLICEYNGAKIIDDYAHHPVEIKATLETAKTIAKASSARVISFFQPHKYSRLENLFSDFTQCFIDSDKTYITEVFAAGENPIDGISGKILSDAISKTGIRSEFIANHENISNIIKETAKEGDIIILMGAGTITHWANDLSKTLCKEHNIL